ncbi:MAG TPA: type II toxin-antitoxin system VapC family toxin [Armatimonadota bacterium]|jgi:predicted nucleic acid-binding protein
MRVYLDAAPVIYLIERVAPFDGLVRTYLTTGQVALVASEITRLETRTRPIRDNQAAILANFDSFYSSQVSEIVALDRAVIDAATRIRAEHGFRTPDAIHLAAAMVAVCDIFLTNDRRLAGFPGISIVLVDELI